MIFLQLEDVKVIKLLDNEFVKYVLKVNDHYFKLNRARMKDLYNDLCAQLGIEKVSLVEPDRVKIIGICSKENQVFAQLDDNTEKLIGLGNSERFQRYIGKPYFDFVKEVCSFKEEDKNE